MKSVTKKNGLILLIGYILIILVTVGISSLIANHRNKKDIRDQLLSDLIKVQQIQLENEEKYKQDFINKSFLARQVYQFQWYKRTETKVGKLNLEKVFAMDLKEYNDLMELSWELNQELNIPWNSWENYIIEAKWILESAICNQIKHKTGEIIRMAGYTEGGFRDAWFHYKHDLNITSSRDPFYIEELFQKYLTTEQIMKIMEDPLKVARFDYAYYSYIHNQYDEQWDWSLTSFHFGDGKTLYWKGAGLKMIPNYRLDGKWKNHYMREYYQTVLEIAQGIALGKMTRPSRYNRVVKKFARAYNARNKYIQALRIKLKSEEKAQKILKDFEQLNKDFEEYKTQQEELMRNLAKLSDLTLDYRRAPKERIKQEMDKLKGKIKRGWNKLFINKGNKNERPHKNSSRSKSKT